ncbi:hypothetical protein FS837_003783 [Tulasnella sp. UAMH 9824]|nr:hypothetical protein FS837_003783 [Tulasnella sp. UAMH 9824]
MNAGPSTPSSSAQANSTHVELKSKIVRVTMPGGFWESSDVGATLFANDNVFPSAELAAAQLEAWTKKRDWGYSLISDEELDTYLAYAESLADAVRQGIQVPTTLSSPSDDQDEDVANDIQLAIMASLRPPTSPHTRSISPPPKRRKISEDGSSVPTGSSLPPTFTAADVWAAMEDLHEDLLLEWIPNQRTSKPSEKALGKRPER